MSDSKCCRDLCPFEACGSCWWKRLIDISAGQSSLIAINALSNELSGYLVVLELDSAMR
jgi:hypothetical protein